MNSNDLDPNPKWYLYDAATNKPEGPYPAAEVQDRLTQRKIVPSSYIWAEGMADWVPMSDVPELESILKSFKPIPEKEYTGTLQRITPLKGEPTPPSSETDFIPVEENTIMKKAKSSVKRILFFILFGAALGGGTYGYLQGHFDPILNQPAVKDLTQNFQPKMFEFCSKIPALNFLTTFVSPIIVPRDVSVDELEGLTDAARAVFSERGPKGAVVVSNAAENNAAPVIIITSNVPNGTQMEVKLTGVPETLLGQFENEASQSIVVENRIARTKGFSGAKNTAFPKGDYRIELMLSETQSPEVQALLKSSPKPIDPKKVLAKSYLFLGGEKDAAYTTKLKEFHDKAKAQADKELADAKQFLNSVEAQFKQTETEFDRIRKIKNFKAASAAWNKFHLSFDSFQKPLKDAAGLWSPQMISESFFYGPLFEKIKTAMTELEGIHQIHHQAMSGKAAPKEESFKDARAQASGKLQTIITESKELISKIETQNKESGGLPRKIK